MHVETPQKPTGIESSFMIRRSKQAPCDIFGIEAEPK